MSDIAGREMRPGGRGGRYLTFYLEEEEYGVEILKVREIIGLLPITRVPRTPASVLGVVNLREKVIPVLDLRSRLGMDEGADDERSCIVVVHAGGAEFGVKVDQVSEVSEFDPAEVEGPPSFGTEIATDFLLGMAKSEGRVTLLLDIERVLASSDIGALQAAAEVSAA